MSNFNGHRNGGIISAMVVAGGMIAISQVAPIHFKPTEILLSSSVAFGFSLFPDIDTKSTPSRWFYGILLVLFGFMYFKGLHQVANIVAIIACVPQITKHRGILHSKITAIILPAFPLILYNIGVMKLDISVALFISGVLGYYTHLILDMR